MLLSLSLPLLIQNRCLVRALRGLAWAALLITLFGIPARAQTHQVWPEASTFVKLNDKMRFYFLATTVKESEKTTEGEYGPNFDFYLKPLRQKTRLAVFRLDESKNRLLMVRVGYHYIHPYTEGGSSEHRGILEATARYPLKGGSRLESESPGYPVNRRRELLALPQQADHRKGILHWPLQVRPLWPR
jgi:hypothetical protein